MFVQVTAKNVGSVFYETQCSNANLLLHMLIATLGTFILLRITQRNLTYNMAVCTWWPYRI